MTRAARRVAMVMAAGWMIATGCGLPSEPVEVPARDLPFTLGSPEPSGSPADGTLRVHFVRGGRLVAVSRRVATDESPPETAMRALLDGPTEAERRRGIASEILPRTEILEVRVVELIAEVDLSGEFEAPAPQHSVLLRLAQVVWTLVALPDITAVRFVVDGEPVAVATDRGIVVDRPVAASDYATVSPPGWPGATPGASAVPTRW